MNKSLNLSVKVLSTTLLIWDTEISKQILLFDVDLLVLKFLF